MNYYQCPVCFYNQMLDPPEDFNICPCCGTEFGNDDFELNHAELRERWEAGGLLWFSKFTPQPFNWDPIAQITGLGQIRTIPISISVSVIDYPNHAYAAYGDAVYVR